METLFTTAYDEQLNESLPHLKNYPQLIPFIGSQWYQSNEKILFIGESHYIPGYELEDGHSKNWYKYTSDSFYKQLADYIHTRRVVYRADNRTKEGFDKPLSIFYEIK